ncbi:anoctamin-9 [Chanos chanos]|uniref:Anoctamin n=1 Tax=Chanos chanos TaxID=29144 RepID=A0A6J2WQ47_CHACN|nr:anoctamin-9-like [Chanos chanos]
MSRKDSKKFGHRRQGSIDLLEVMGVVRESSTETLAMPPVNNPLSFDYVLVAKNVDDESRELVRKRVQFIDALKNKNLQVKKMISDDKVFYGITAPSDVFDKYRYLLKVSDTCNWSCEQQGTVAQSTRIRLVDFILNHTSIENDGEFTSVDNDEYLPDLMKKNVFEAEFCLHEKKDQKELRTSWARWTACFQGQPISQVREYFGEKVALYYLWLGWYTFLLIPAAFIGVVVFLYGLSFYQTSPLIKEVCDSDTIMCPLCDKTCKVWQLSDTCTYAKLSRLFDNGGTVAFAMFMAVWATVFLEFWKRHRASYVSEWSVFDWCEEEEELILELLNDPEYDPEDDEHSYLCSTVVLILTTIMLLLIIGLTHALVVFRVIALFLFAEYSPWQFLKDNSSMAALMLGAVLHYIIITVMTRVNRIVAMKLCQIEKGNSLTAAERSFTVKMFIFQFFTLFSSLIYTAFFLGRINGHPGGYVRISGKWRLEECHPSGCLTDLFIQMSIIMVLKQIFNNVFEYTGPWCKSWLKRKQTGKQKRMCSRCCDEETSETKQGAELCENCKLLELNRNYTLNKVDSFSLFDEFLEMVIQFSFTTIFVAAFPLAPLLALLNNIIEIRLDAIKMVCLERRLVPKKTNDIGVWIDVLEAIGVFAVIANGLVIGITSDFIPRLVYRYHYGPCANSSSTDIDCMVGYINNTLSIARIDDENVRKDFQPTQLVTPDGVNVTHCSYKDYRNNEDFSFTPQFWFILAIRLGFIILFEHVVVIFKSVAGWFVPSSPLEVKNCRRRVKLKRLREELNGCTSRNITENFNCNTSEKGHYRTK